MEDTHVAIDNLRETFPSLPENKHYSFHAVYDGHGGKETAQIAEEYLHKNLVADPNFASNNYEAALTVYILLQSDSFSYSIELTNLLFLRKGCIRENRHLFESSKRSARMEVCSSIFLFILCVCV